MRHDGELVLYNAPLNDGSEGVHRSSQNHQRSEPRAGHQSGQQDGSRPDTSEQQQDRRSESGSDELQARPAPVPVETPEMLAEMLPGGLAATLWSSGTRSTTGAALQLDNDGTLSIVTPEGRVLWRGGNSAPDVSATDVGFAGHRHVIYDRGEQRVWLIDADGRMVDNYPVSGRRTSPAPGRYEVISKSLDAVSYNGLVTMRHMVRFTVGVNGGRIGFHSIPRNWHDMPVQTEAELGDALSLGCVRQRDDKAERLYYWAPPGTPVVVLD
ncbi:L,D-transpeptidase [Candidatus Poriferisodalis sp.]|uniref:L,D-transpeptidase n=1 Tax=Candidatus Poriferisodalis sp. TaxID=3101277 RepID=UPI003B0147BC